MPAIARACALTPLMAAMSGMPARDAHLSATAAPGPAAAAPDDFRRVFSEASREAAAGVADTNGPGLPYNEAAESGGSTLPGDAARSVRDAALPVQDTALSVQDIASLSGIHVLMHATVSARPLNLPGLDETTGQRAATDRHDMPVDIALLQSQPSPVGIPDEAAVQSGPTPQHGRSAGAAGTHHPPAVEDGAARMIAATPSAITAASQTKATALARATTVRATAGRPAALPSREPVFAPAELVANEIRTAAEGSAALATAILQGPRPPAAQQATAVRARTEQDEVLAPPPHGIELAREIVVAREMSLTEDGSIDMPGHAEHEAGSVPEALAWLGHGESTLAVARTPGDDADPNAAVEASAALSAGTPPAADVRPGHIRPERMLDIPQHPASMQWREQFVDRVRFLVGERTQTAEVRLHPAEMGPVSIQISISDQQASIVFLAAHEDTRRHITEALPQLRDMLSESGVRLGNASVDDHPQPDAQSRQPDARGRQTPATAITVAPVRMTAGKLNRHLIDTYA